MLFWKKKNNNEKSFSIDYMTLYNKLGGYHKIDKISKNFYARLLNDSRINHFFCDTNINILISKQIKFLSFVFGGSKDYEGPSLSKAHKHLKIKNEDFDIVKQHFHDTLLEFNNINPDDIQSAMMILESTRKSICK